MKRIKRNFYPGDEWLYFKIYGGIKTCDDLICGKLYTLMKKLKRDKIIDKWFFIRYSDPDFHIRLRLHITTPEYMWSAICAINKLLRPLCDTYILNRFIIDTYNREIERYGNENILPTEELFCIDSDCICNILRRIKDKSPNYRWLAAFVSIDNFLSALGFNIEERLSYVTLMSQSYRAEFGYDEYNGKQLNSIYRNRRKLITQALEQPDPIIGLHNIFKLRTKKIRELNIKCALNITSLMHMMMNRHFASRNRTNELLIYDFLKRYYNSKMCRLH